MSKADDVVEALDRHPELRDEVRTKLNEPDPKRKPSHNGLATVQGKEYALRCLAWRRANQPQQINNASLYAGSPMYYYCRARGHQSDVLPESYITPPKKMCLDCFALKELDWLE